LRRPQIGPERWRKLRNGRLPGLSARRSVLDDARLWLFHANLKIPSDTSDRIDRKRVIKDKDAIYRMRGAHVSRAIVANSVSGGLYLRVGVVLMFKRLICTQFGSGSAEMSLCSSIRPIQGLIGAAGRLGFADVARELEGCV
jgi:hypothetical protein